MAPELRAQSLLHRPGRYAEDYDCGDPGRPSFVLPEVPFNKELVKYVDFNTIPLDHPGPNPSRERYLAAQEGRAVSPEEQMTSPTSSEMSTQAAKVVNLDRPSPIDKTLRTVDLDKDDKLETAIEQWWEVAHPEQPLKRYTSKKRYPGWGDLSEGTQLVIMSDLTIGRGLNFDEAARLLLGLSVAEGEAFLQLYDREWHKNEVYEVAFQDYFRRRCEALTHGVRLLEVIPSPDLVTNIMTAEEIKLGRAYLISLNLGDTAANLGRWEGVGTGGLVDIDWSGDTSSEDDELGDAEADSDQLEAASSSVAASPVVIEISSTENSPYTQTAPGSTAQSHPSVEASTPAPPPKRRRGRPRKHPLPVVEQAPQPSNITQELTAPPAPSGQVEELSNLSQKTTALASSAEAAELSNPGQELTAPPSQSLNEKPTRPRARSERSVTFNSTVETSTFDAMAPVTDPMIAWQENVRLPTESPAREPIVAALVNQAVVPPQEGLCTPTASSVIDPIIPTSVTQAMAPQQEGIGIPAASSVPEHGAELGLATPVAEAMIAQQENVPVPATSSVPEPAPAMPEAEPRIPQQEDARIPAASTAPQYSLISLISSDEGEDVNESFPTIPAAAQPVAQPAAVERTRPRRAVVAEAPGKYSAFYGDADFSSPLPPEQDDPNDRNYNGRSGTRNRNRNRTTKSRAPRKSTAKPGATRGRPRKQPQQPEAQQDEITQTEAPEPEI